jgi:hypothetical protein
MIFGSWKSGAQKLVITTPAGDDHRAVAGMFSGRSDEYALEGWLADDLAEGETML